MTYQEYLQAVEHLDFIESTEEADAAVKAVLGILASRLDEPQARKLTENLPEPLTYERLRGHQVRKLQISASEFFSELATELNLTEDEARQVATNVFHVAKQDIGDETLRELEDVLPWDWARTIEKS